LKDLLLAFDPSMTCAGYAVLHLPAGDKLEDAGVITSEGETLFQRGTYLRNEAQKLIAQYVDRLAALVIEFPLEATAGMAAKRTASTLPTYGLAVGSIAFGVRWPAGLQVITPPAEWAQLAGLPGAKKDKHKEKRVRLVETIYGLQPGALGAKTKAGNAADAILLARWAVMQVKPCH